VPTLEDVHGFDGEVVPEVFDDQTGRFKPFLPDFKWIQVVVACDAVEEAVVSGGKFVQAEFFENGLPPEVG